MKQVPLPHSWSISTWPLEVWPHDPKRARWLLRSQRDELIEAGCLARVGRELVVHGSRYDRWLQRQSGNVAGYEFPGRRDPARPTA